MARPTRRHFTVEGSSHFPIDMLRHDHCWPLSETKDSPAIEQTAYSEPKPQRRVVLATDNPSAPTIGRWESMGWRVVAACEARDPTEFPTPIRLRRA